MKEIKISVSEGKQIKAQNDLFGIFFEDINHAADGGLYGEMVQNRAFEFDPIDNKTYCHMTAWEEVQRGNSFLQAHIEQWDPRNARNPHYLVLEVLEAGEGAGIRNEGYNTGLSVEQGKEYRFTSWCRIRGGQTGAFEVRLENAEGTRCYGQADIELEAGGWKKKECRIQSHGTDAAARLVILMRQVMTVEFDVISLFPADTYRGRENGLRADIAGMLEAMKPRFLRFPGGCLTHIGSLEERDRNAMYRWKSTLGDVWDRPARRNSWDYNQTLGLGYYEYFQFCEDIGAKPLPVISAGFDPHFLRMAPMDDMEEWIREGTDLIEFANGDVDTRWGAVRAAMGHPESFHLEYLAVGNEEVGDEYYERYEKILQGIKAVYPRMKLINSAGPCAAGSEFDKGWEQAKRTDTAFADEHFYQCPEWFVANTDRYDKCNTKAKAFLGEYASHGMSWWNALAESAFMIGMEKGEGVGLACYAPLLDNVAYTNWKTTLLHHDNHQVYGTPSYYVQKLFMNYQGEKLVASETDCSPVKAAPPVLKGRARIYGYHVQTLITDMVIRNEDTGEEKRAEDFRVTEENGKELPDIPWENYTISFRYRREAGATLQALEGSRALYLDFAMGDEGNCLRLVIDGWERTATLHGVVNGLTCGVGMMQVILEKDRAYDCEVRVYGSHVKATVDGNVVEHDFRSVEPEAIYQSAVLDGDGSLIVKLTNLKEEAVKISVITERKYQKVQEIAISGCKPEWENSFEEPEKVSPKEKEITLEGHGGEGQREYLCTVGGYELKILKFMV